MDYLENRVNYLENQLRKWCHGVEFCVDCGEIASGYVHHAMLDADILYVEPLCVYMTHNTAEHASQRLARIRV